MFDHRSAALLLAAGAASLSLDARVRVPKLKGTAEALRADKRAIAADGRRALSKAKGGYAKRG